MKCLACGPLLVVEWTNPVCHCGRWSGEYVHLELSEGGTVSSHYRFCDGCRAGVPP